MTLQKSHAVSEALKAMEENEIARAVRVRLNTLPSETSSSFMFFFLFRSDIEGNCGCIFHYCLHDRAYS
jgi:hypothetical protein